MNPIRDGEYLSRLVQELRKLESETELVEFKADVVIPDEIGEYISAFANSAALNGRAFAHVIWGIEDATRNLVGTSFAPTTTKVGNEELENWLLQLLSPKPEFRFCQTIVEEHRVVILEIARTVRHPVQFKGQEYIRIGSYKKKLKDFPEKERALWRALDTTPWEALIAAEEIGDAEVLRILNHSAYFQLLNLPTPEHSQAVLDALEKDRLICRTASGAWNVFNLGAVLLARRLQDFGNLRRKAVRVVVYKGKERTAETMREQEGKKGYAVGFEGLVDYINSQLPANEIIQKALRKTVPMYPELAVRELVANAVIHQDFLITGAGPMVEIFDGRMEITNPGAPLVQPERFLDSPPRSRNDAVASYMRRIGVCEERGSGIDKVVFETEFFQLPAPVFEVIEDNTRAILFSHRPLTRMDKADRIRACYLHACLKYVKREYLTNSSVRERFGIEPHNTALASRLIKEALQAGEILAVDPNAAPKMMRYIPWWAVPAQSANP